MLWSFGTVIAVLQLWISLAAAGLIDIPSSPLWSYNRFIVNGMLYDRFTDTLYLSVISCAILAVYNVTDAPYEPVGAAPWNFTVYAGHIYIGQGGLFTYGYGEVRRQDAVFGMPNNLVGLPLHVALGKRHPDTVMEEQFVGYFVMDVGMIRFINFLRGGNVMVLAGTQPSGPAAVDGDGPMAQLPYPSDGAITFAPNGTWYFIYVESYLSAQLRLCQILNVTTNYDGSPRTVSLNPDGTPRLQDMMFRLSLFIPAWQPRSVVVVRTGATSEDAFVGTSMGLALISPMWPADSRHLWNLWNTGLRFPGTVGPLYISNIRATVFPLQSTVELFIATGDAWTMNMTYSWNSSGLMDNWQIPNIARAERFPLFNYTGGIWSLSIRSQHYIPSRNGPVLIQAGMNGGTAADSFLSFNCCFTGRGFPKYVFKTPTVAMTKSRDTLSPSVPTNSPTMSTTVVERATRTVSASVPRPPTPTLRSTSTLSPHATRSATASLGLTKETLPMQPTRTLRFINSSVDRAQVGLLLSSGLKEMRLPNVTSTAVVQQVLQLGASNPGVASGRVFGVWRCEISGLAEVALDDPQLFLSFGLAIGDDELGTIRGALLITSFGRLGIILGLAALVNWVYYKEEEAPSTLVSLVAVSLGYFTPNVLGLITIVFTSSDAANDMPTLLAAIGSLVAELIPIGIVTAGVFKLGTVCEKMAFEFIDPFRLPRRLIYKVAGLEDLLSAVLTAVVSNLPRTNQQQCQIAAWGLAGICAAHLLYVAILRPYVKKWEVAATITLSAINTAFAILCCLVAKDESGANIVETALQIVTYSFYIVLFMGVAEEFIEGFQALCGSSKKEEKKRMFSPQRGRFVMATLRERLAASPLRGRFVSPIRGRFMATSPVRQFRSASPVGRFRGLQTIQQDYRQR